MLETHYLDIEKLPLQNWIDCNKGDLTKTRLDIKVGDEEIDSKAWEAIYNDFIQRVGLSEEFNEMIELMTERAKCQIEYLEIRKRFLLNRVNDLTRRIDSLSEELNGSSNKSSITAILNQLSKQQGYQLKINDLTTLAYFELIKAHNTNGKPG